MVQAESAFGGLVNPRTLPRFLLGLGLLLVVLSFFVGWYSVDAKLRRWQHDPQNPPDYEGPFLSPLSKIDLEMRMLSIATEASPAAVQNLIESRGGAPTYEDHAGRMGTVMLGVLLMQFAVLVAFVTTTAFYLMQARRRTDYAGVTKRLFILLFCLLGVTLLYFSVRIGPAAQEDEEVILEAYPFSDQVAYAPLKPDLGFWKQWKSDKTTVTIQGDNRQVWEFEVVSRPSAGWWLSMAAFGCAVAARVAASRNGDLDWADTADTSAAAVRTTFG